MLKNKVSDLITDQEMSFARLILSGGMTDRKAAEAAGLNPDTAAYTKSKPHVRAYMLQHRAAVEEKLIQQEADLSRLPRQAVGQAVEGIRRLSIEREQVLGRLWEIANLGPEMTRNSMTSQVKALSMIIAMENFIPDRKAISEKVSPTPPARPKIYEAAWLGKHQATTMEPPPSPVPAPPPAPASRGASLENHLSPSEAQPPAPSVSVGAFVPDARTPFSMKRNPFSRFARRR
jgi:hypothetical protein